jgi:hypothetical protein
MAAVRKNDVAPMSTALVDVLRCALKAIRVQDRLRNGSLVVGDGRHSLEYDRVVQHARSFDGRTVTAACGSASGAASIRSAR